MKVVHILKNGAEARTLDGYTISEEKTRTIMKLMKEVITEGNEKEIVGITDSGNHGRNGHENTR